MNAGLFPGWAGGQAIRPTGGGVEIMTRQDFMLAVLAAGNGEALTPVQVQKLFFLLDKNVGQRFGGPWFDFQPYDYGPFDKAVYENLRELEAKGLVTITALTNGLHSYRPTPAGLSAGQTLLGQLPAPTGDYIRRLSTWVRQQSFTSLVSGICQQFPEMGTKSVFREAQ
jgi:hypothetical protein